MEFEFLFNNKSRFVTYIPDDNLVCFRNRNGYIYGRIQMPDEVKGLIPTLNTEQLTTLFHSIAHVYCTGVKHGNIEQRERVKSALGLYDKDKEEMF